ncbi:MAG: glycosyltransferase family 2 protein [Cyclobacteriaceae bacterium]
MTKVAVVILNYNGRSYLERFLPHLIEHTPDADIIVADNASTDDSVKLLKDQFPSIRLIQLEKNHGYAGGYNHALTEVKAEYYVLLNSDIEVSDRWLAPLIYFLDSNENYAGCQPKILDFNKRDYFEYAGAAGGYVDRFGYPFCRGRIFDHIEKDHGQYDDETDVTWASGACLVMRSKIYHELGGLDQDFFAHMEEIDLCWRVLNKGYLFRFIPSSVVYHVGGGTLTKASAFKTFLNFRNGLFLLIKNMPLRSLLWKFPIRLKMDWIAFLRFILMGEFSHAIAIPKAHIYVIRYFGKMVRKRTKPFNASHKHYSIVYRYFIRKKKVYSDY